MTCSHVTLLYVLPLTGCLFGAASCSSLSALLSSSSQKWNDCRLCHLTILCRATLAEMLQNCLQNSLMYHLPFCVPRILTRAVISTALKLKLVLLVPHNDLNMLLRVNFNREERFLKFLTLMCAFH